MIFRLGRGYQPEEVFTPRSAKINPILYISRPELERQVNDGIRSTKHVVIHGESGNGKSWLYKKVFSDEEIKYEVVNLANASRLGSLNAAFQNKLDRLEQETSEGSSKTLALDFKPGGVGPSGHVENHYTTGKMEPFEKLISLYAGTRRKPSVIVLDNFEAVVELRPILKEISDVIILLDDEDYSKYSCKLCIVGVPAEIREYLASQSQVATISSRLFEVEEVARMTESEARMLLEIGLEDLLNLEFDSEDFRRDAYRDILFVSDRIATELQELGLFIAQRAVKNARIINEHVLNEAIGAWITHSHTAMRQTIEARLNSRETFPGRKNQCIYCLGLIENEEFRYTEVEQILRNNFPETTNNTTLNVAGILTELATGANAPIKRVPKGDAYRFSNPKYRMAIRALLRKLTNERVVKNNRRL